MALDPILTFSMLLGLSFLFVIIPVVLSFFMRPRIPDKQEKTPYECGELPVGPARNLGFGYYAYAVVYLIFEVSLALIFLLAVSINQLSSIFTIGILSSVFGILSIGMAYFFSQVKKIEV